jgi:hypothetical protein
MENRKVGRRITAQEQEYFRKGIKMFYISSLGNFLERAFHKTLLKFFGVEYEMRDGVSRTILPPLEELPTFRQFYYLYNKEFTSKLITIQPGPARNQRTLLQSRQSTEANLLPNPHLDCNQNDPPQSARESDSYSIKDLTSLESNLSEEGD